MGGRGSGPQTSIMKAQGLRIRTLLQNPCITYAEIGRRVGVTRERIRQIHDKVLRLKPEGRERQAVCSFNNPILPPEDSLAVSLKKKCEKLGLPFEFVFAKYKENGNTRFGRWNAARVNGKLCLLRRASYHPKGYVRFGAARVNCDFLLYRIARGGARWIILPFDKRPAHGTMFAEKPMSGVGRAKMARHDYPDYIEAWHLLR